MDRSDEFDRDLRDVEGVSSREERTGDILGLGGAPVPKSSYDPSTARDPEAPAKAGDRIFTVDGEQPLGRTAKWAGSDLDGDATRPDESDE
jgi:hypothetical protein